MPQKFRKNLKLKWGDIKTRVRGNITAIIWKDKRDVNILTNMYHPSEEGNFCDEHGNALKPAIIPNSYLFLISCREKLSHWNFQ
jgi:hypothetical protein